MPVEVNEYVTVRDDQGKECTGRAIGTNLICIEDGEERFFGSLVKLDHISTKIICDNEKCINSHVNDSFQTTPKTIEFIGNGDESVNFIKDISEVVILTDWKGQRNVFCSERCSHSYYKNLAHEQAQRKIVDISSGKGFRTSGISDFRQEHDTNTGVEEPTRQE